MKVPQSQIDDLAARPTEALAVEIKSWIDPMSPEGAAKIARACLAMRNQNGGFLVIGFNDKTLQLETSGRPENVREAFHADKIQQIVTRYAFESFEIEVAFSERDGANIPVIVIPSGVQYPIASKADLVSVDGKKLVRSGEVYCRTLNSNGSVSTAAAGAKDWRDIFERCFDNREADIGRFLRRHLGPSADTLLSGARSPTQREHMTAFLDEGFARFQQAVSPREPSASELQIVNGAKFEVGLILDPLKSDQLPTQSFLHTLITSNPRLTGWPTWLDSSDFHLEHARPVVRNGSWEALILVPLFGRARLDFNWFDPNGRFYLQRSFQDDTTDGIEAGTMLDPILVLLRVAEAIAVGLSFARALSWGEDATLRFGFRWRKLAGRRMMAWAHPEVYFSARPQTATQMVTSYVDVPIDTALNSIAPAVEAATRPIFAEFGGFEFPTSATEQWVQKLIDRRL